MGFKIYKRGQGYYTRLITGLVGGAMAANGCWRLYQVMGGIQMDATTRIVVQSVIPAALMVALGLLIYWILNKPSIADFMISAEGELKKVSWSSRKEITSSTIIVIGVVAVMSVLLLVVDVVLRSAFEGIGLLQ